MTEQKKTTVAATTADKSLINKSTQTDVVENIVSERSAPEIGERVVKSDLNAPEELPDEIKKKLEKNQADRKVLKKKGKKKKIAQKVVVGVAHVKATYNNTIVTLTDLTGNVISWASAGLAGFKGPKKSTPYAAQIITRIAVEKAKQLGLQEVTVFVKGVGTGRESAIRALNANGLIVSSIKDVTPIPHNGCRPKKPRRV